MPNFIEFQSEGVGMMEIGLARRMPERPVGKRPASSSMTADSASERPRWHRRQVGERMGVELEPFRPACAPRFPDSSCSSARPALAIARECVAAHSPEGARLNSWYRRSLARHEQLAARCCQSRSAMRGAWGRGRAGDRGPPPASSGRPELRRRSWSPALDGRHPHRCAFRDGIESRPNDGVDGIGASLALASRPPGRLRSTRCGHRDPSPASKRDLLPGGRATALRASRASAPARRPIASQAGWPR